MTAMSAFRFAIVALLGTCIGASDAMSNGNTHADGNVIEAEQCKVRFADEVEVPAMETGRVEKMMVQLNDSVQPDSPIARLDGRSLAIRRRAAMLKFNAAKAELSDDVEVRYAKVALSEAKAELDTSNAVHDDVRGVIPMNQIRRLRLAVERGELEIVLAQRRYKERLLESQLLESELAVLDNQLDNLEANSPISGVIIEVMRSPGEWVDKGQTIAKIGQLDRLNVHALVRGDLLSPANCRGLPISVHWTDLADGKPRSLSGKVSSADPQTLPGNQYRLHAEITNETIRSASGETQWLLTPGTPVRMKIYVPTRVAGRGLKSLIR